MDGMRVGLKTSLNATTGYGRDGIGLVRALTRAGAQVSLQPTQVYPPLPQDICMALAEQPAADVDVLIHHVDPANLGLTEYDVAHAGQVLAWSMWEYTKFSEPMVDLVAPRLSGYHKMLAYDETSRSAFDGLGAAAPTSILQGGFEPDEWILRPEDRSRDWYSDEFVFIIAGDLTPRKNAYAAMRTVQRLADDGFDVVLRVKSRAKLPTQISQLYPVVQTFDGIWDQQQMREFYATAHAYLAPSWGEGKNLPALESATTGCVPVLSACGGHSQWAQEGASILVSGCYNNYSEMPYLVVDEDRMFEECRTLVENRTLARSLGDAAASTYPSSMSWDRAVADLSVIVERGVVNVP